MSKRLNYFKQLVGIVGLMHASILHAQIKPDVTALSVPNPTGTVSIPNKPPDYPAGTSVNYIRVWQPQQPTPDETYLISTSRTVDQVNVSTQYFDGLSRPLQTVSWQASPAKQDVVAPVIYDGFGREQYKFLPYTSPTSSPTDKPGQFKINPFTEQSTFYTTTYKAEQPAYTNEKFFYSKKNFEPSPLNRVTKNYGPGNSWVGSEGSIAEKTTKVLFDVNIAADAVRIWKVDFNTTIADNTNIPYSNSNDLYNAGELYKTVIVDEGGNAIVEYKDKEDHIILKKTQVGTIPADFSGYAGFICTYYVYDDYGQLRTVLQPKAVAAMITAGNWILTQTIVNELCFRYEYDYRQRLIAKKVPGSGWIYMVYDVRDRLVFFQDANMRSKSPQQWNYTFYDALNRAVQAGIMTYTGSWTALESGIPGTEIQITESGTSQNINPADMYVNMRETGRVLYQSVNSITFDNGFISEDNASFVAQITTEAASTFNNNVIVNTYPVPTSGATLYPLIYTYYDDYNAATKTYNIANNSKLDDGGNSFPESLPSTSSVQTNSMVTTTKIRVIEDPTNLLLGKWLETTNFYNDKARLIQVQSTNYKGGNDVVTNRYDFTGKVVSNYIVHANVSGNVNNLRILSSINYDHVGRPETITKTINDDVTNNKRVIVTKIYDALGQSKNKKIGQKSATDATPLEDDNYNYNIRGWLKDINWYASGGAYASQMSSASNKWFSMDLSYDWGFSTANQYNGNISGNRWKTAGDGQERAYGFRYDPANRLLEGDFTQNNGGWVSDPVVNFSMKVGDGITASVAYDENGNILKMWQRGITGVSNSVIDNLSYSYFSTGTISTSNKLSAVTEVAPAVDNKLGDFTDNNTSGNDYGYDLNGNLITDLNKRILGATGIDQTSGGAITYNFLNLPWKVVAINADGISNKGIITYIYDATGNKLEKRVDESKSTYNNNISKQTTTTYIGGFVYENNVLQFFSHEEGRVRYRADRNTYVYDYFIKDHLGDVRLVLTDDKNNKDLYPPVSFEDANLTSEQDYYDNVDVQRTTRPGPFFTSGTNGVEVQLLSKSTNSLGAGKLLKVMANDKLDVMVDYYIPTATTDNSTANGLNSVITSLLSLLNASDAPAALKGNGAAITGNLNTSGPFTTFLQPQNASIPNSSPKAYLNIIFFDEQFKFVQSNSQVVPANVTGTPQHIIKINSDAFVAPNNGYVYIYVSNESNNLVYFDNLQITHERSPLLEETHYYPFGLTMSGISSKAAGIVENKIKFQEQEFAHGEFSDGSGLEMYEFKWRMHDPQTGRFWQIDPLSEKYVYNSTYAFSENKVTGHRELEGLEAFNVNDNDNGTRTVTLHKVDAPFSVQYNGQKMDAFPQQNMNDFYRNNLVVQGNSDLKGGVASVKQVDGSGQVIQTFYDNTPGTKDANLDQASFNFPAQTPLNMQSVPTSGTESNNTMLQSSNVENKNISNSNTGGVPITGDGTAVLSYSSMGGEPKTFNVTNTTSTGTVLWQASFTGTSSTGSPAILSLQPGTMLNITVTQPTSNTNPNYNYTVKPLDVTKPVDKTLPVN